jgi:hypothetical protein
MPNMSYCRFENTARALQDCVNALQDNEVENLSTYEVIDSNKERQITD